MTLYVFCVESFGASVLIEILNPETLCLLLDSGLWTLGPALCSLLSASSVHSHSLKDFSPHLSPVLNAICHVGKSPGMILMTGKCFQKIEPCLSTTSSPG